MGKKGARKRKPRRHLPKVSGSSGQLWSGESPITYEALERSIGSAGPKAQARYFRAHTRVASGSRIAVLIVAAGMLASVLAAVILR